MQQEKIVLPKFTVPGQRNWVKWALVGVGGLVALSVLTLTLALSQRGAPETTAAEAQKPAEAPLAPSATPRPVSKPSALAAVATPPPDNAARPAEDIAPAKVKVRPRRAHTTHKTLAKASGSSSSSISSKSSAGKSDPLDDILKRFK